MSNPFDQFDEQQSGNPFDQFEPAPNQNKTAGLVDKLPQLEMAQAHGMSPIGLQAAHAPTPTPNADLMNQWVSPAVRGTLEGGGSLAGMLFGSGLGPAGAAGGGILGYAGGAELADLFDIAAGARKPKTAG